MGKEGGKERKKEPIRERVVTPWLWVGRKPAEEGRVGKKDRENAAHGNLFLRMELVLT